MISKMEFKCKLAHCEEIKVISDFNSIKQLYEKIGQIFSIPSNEILFCTINTHDFKNMEALLGNYLSIGDLIVVHMCGKSKELELNKIHQYLGLTITDNGYGRAFVKKVGSENESICLDIQPGDHIAAIDSYSTLGLRHYEVAKAIREIPQGKKFRIHLIEPLCVSYVEQKTSINHYSDNRIASDNNLIRQHFADSTIYEDLANSSLPIERLLSKSYNYSTDESVSNLYRSVIEEINTILESFLGINDNALAIQIYRLAKDNKISFQSFNEAILDSELNVFNFDEGTKRNLWNCVIES